MELDSPMNVYRTLAYLDDPRNDDVLVYVDGSLIPRDQASISVYDNGFSMGDALCETFRLVQGRIGMLDLHLDRLLAGAEALEFEPAPTRASLTQALAVTLEGNDMADAVNLRLMLTRGRKRMPDQDPRSTISACTIVVIPEFKVFRPHTDTGVALATSKVQYAAPESCDLRIKSVGRLNDIQALMRAVAAGADAALMLDRRGFVAGSNAANFFMVHGGALCTSKGAFCFDGITRRVVMTAWRAAGGTVLERDIAPEELLAADEAFLTETLGGITPVGRIDQHTLCNGLRGPVTAEVTRLYEAALLAG